MAIEIVTIQEAREHLRIDDYDSEGGPDDPWLNIFIPAVTGAVVSWVKDTDALYETEIDSSGNEVPDLGSPKPVVKAAILIEIERQYRSRGGEDETYMEQFGDAGYGYVLGRGSTALLASLRKSTVA